MIRRLVYPFVVAVFTTASGCVTTDTERMTLCRYMCEVTGVQRFQPLTGECRCNEPYPRVTADYVKKE